jgi:hypothetical protein
VVDRVHRIVLDVLREVDRGQCWEVDRGSWHVDGLKLDGGTTPDAAVRRVYRNRSAADSLGNSCGRALLGT